MLNYSDEDYSIRLIPLTMYLPEFFYSIPINLGRIGQMDRKQKKNLLSRDYCESLQIAKEFELFVAYPSGFFIQESHDRLDELRRRGWLTEE